jgi:hypothetical protein
MEAGERSWDMLERMERDGDSTNDGTDDKSEAGGGTAALIRGVMTQVHVELISLREWRCLEVESSNTLSSLLIDRVELEDDDEENERLDCCKMLDKDESDDGDDSDSNDEGEDGGNCNGGMPAVESSDNE